MKYGATRPGVLSALISNGTSTSRPLPAALAIELVMPGIETIARRATPTAKRNAVGDSEKLLFLFEKFIKCLVDYVLFVRIPVVEFGLAPRDPFGESNRRSLRGIRNPHRFGHPHQLFEKLLGQFDIDSLAQSVFPRQSSPFHIVLARCARQNELRSVI